MIQPRCSAPDCDRDSLKRGMCGKHYQRWRLTATADELRGPRGLCSIDGCERKHYGNGFCNVHWRRDRANGTPGPALIGPYAQSCQIEGCADRHRAQGYCNKHYLRLKINGDPLVLPGPRYLRGEEHRWWAGDDIGYGPAHTRIVRAQGSASSHICQHCGRPAEDWAYAHTATNPKYDEHGRVYSTDPTDYLPLCRHCHKLFDNEVRATG